MKKLLLSAMIIAAAITSCSKKTTAIENNEGKVEIKLSSGVAVSRAALDNTSAITGLAFRRVDQAVNPPIAGLGSAPVLKANRAADGSIAFDVPQYYNADGLIKSWFLSYYPEGTIAGTDVTWDIDGKTDIIVSSIFTAGDKTTPATTPLNYDHTLFMVEILCKAEAGKDTEVQSRWGKVVGVKLKDTPKQRILDVETTGIDVAPTYKASAQVATLPLFDKDFGAFQPITISENNIGVQARGMFVPKDDATIQLIVTTQRDGAGAIDTELPVFTVGGGGGMFAGRKHLLTLTFKPGPGEPEIVLTSTISDWVQGQPGDIPVD